MTESIKSQKFRVIFYPDGTKTFLSREDNRELKMLKPLYEFALQIESKEYTGIIDSRRCAREQECRDNQYWIYFKSSLFEMKVRYWMDEDALYKLLYLTPKTDMTVRYAQTEVSKTFGALTRGGEGQPIFAEDKLFISILFPAAQNYIDQDRVRLEQAPFVRLRAGETFKFFPVIYGFSEKNSLEESVRSYIMKHKKKTPPGLRIYSDWGAHDEMAGEKRLNEAMAMRQLKHLKDARRLGVTFDYYLMDAFWFEEDSPYGKFKAETWPAGQQAFLRELKEMGMKFGLWFDVNLGMLTLPEEALRHGQDAKKLCLGYEENGELLFQGIRCQLKECGCTMLKLDFAAFDCRDEHHNVHSSHPTGCKEPAIRNFLRGLKKLYQEEPNLIVLGYNGFTTDISWIGSVDRTKRGAAISPWWCLYLDYLYCGDPRPSEIPAKDLGKSLIYYTDSMIRSFHDSLLPYCAVDDHGTMIGNTNTIYYLGKGDYRDSLIMNMVRGAKKFLFYGELDLLGKEDWKFIKESQELFDFVCDGETYTKAVAGNPRDEEPYGYLNSKGDRGYLTLVNPGEDCARVYPEDIWEQRKTRMIRVRYENQEWKDDAYSPLEPGNPFVLAPCGILVFQWKEAPQETCGEGEEGYLILEAEECENVIVKGDCCRFSLRLADEEGRPLRFFGGGTDPVSLKALAPHVTVKKIMPQTPVWSGCSWGLYEIQRRLLHGSQEENILLSLTNNSKRRLCVRTQAFLSRACEADSTVKVKFYSPEEVEDSLLKFAVIVSRCGEQWVFCRHKERSSYECPGGHREERETLEETARRELYEETGAKAYELKEICVYSVIHSDPKTGEESESFGMLFGARIQSLGALPRDFEMAEVKLTKALPEEWTYPQIQPFLLKKAWEEYFM